MNLQIRYSFLLILFLIMTGCGGKHMELDSRFSIPPQPNTTHSAKEGGVTYKKDILPLFEKRCSECHNASSSYPNWLNYQIAYQKRDKIFARTVTNRNDMPKNRPRLEDAEVELIARWIQSGAPESEDSIAISSPTDPQTSAPPTPVNPPQPPTQPQTDPASPPVENSPALDPIRENISYEKTIQPIFKKVCAECHNSDSGLPNWLDYSTALEKKDLIFKRIYIDKDMPMEGSAEKLPPEQRTLIGIWTMIGAPK